MKKKILFITNSLTGGGAEKVLITILKRIDYEKYDIDLCLITKTGIYLDEVPHNVRLISLFDKSNSIIARVEARIYRHLRIKLFDRLRVRRKVDKNYDSIISFLEGKPLRMHSYLIGRAKSNISWIHTDLFDNHNTVGASFSQRDEINAYQKMNKLVFVSKEAKSQFQKRFLIDVPQVVLYNPIDKDSIIINAKKNDIKKRKFTICSVGSLTEVKRFDRVIRLAKKLKDGGYDIDFWIIGEGFLKKELLELVINLGLNDMVHFLGFVNPPYPYIKVADIFLLSSKAEGFPLVLCEALCLGVPIIATACTGPIEILDRGKYGVLSDHDDDSIYLNVKSLIDDKTKLEAYALASEKRSKMFNINLTMQNFYDIIDARSDFGV